MLVVSIIKLMIILKSQDIIYFLEYINNFLNLWIRIKIIF